MLTDPRERAMIDTWRSFGRFDRARQSTTYLATAWVRLV